MLTLALGACSKTNPAITCLSVSAICCAAGRAAAPAAGIEADVRVRCEYWWPRTLARGCIASGARASKR
jgi:hypothetical protein